MSLSAENTWALALDSIRPEGKTYALTWLERMRPLEVRENALVLGVPDRFFRDWVDDHYRALLEGTLARVADGVCHFIAKNVHKNVRELEGALVKVSAVHSLTGQAVTEEFAAHVLKDLLPANRPLDVETIQREVARYYRVAAEALREDRRHKALAHARQVAMYLSRRLTKCSFPEIGVHFAKDHSTVISAVRKVERLRDTDPGVKRELDELEGKLGNH